MLTDCRGFEFFLVFFHGSVLCSLEQPPPDWRRRRGRPSNTWLIRPIQAHLQSLNCGLLARALWQGRDGVVLSEQQNSKDYAIKEETEVYAAIKYMHARTHAQSFYSPETDSKATMN